MRALSSFYARPNSVVLGQSWPGAAQQQRNAAKQQAQRRMTGGSLDTSLTEWAVAGLDAEAIPVDLEDPLRAFRCHAPKAINQGLMARAAA
jgi:hypothetical protein